MIGNYKFIFKFHTEYASFNGSYYANAFDYKSDHPTMSGEKSLWNSL